MIDKIKHEYTKPRSGKIFKFMHWVLNNPLAFSVMIILSSLFGCIFFAVLSILIYFNYGLEFAWITAIFSIISGYKSVKTIIAAKKLGLNQMYYGLTANEIVWRKENGNNRTNQTTESDTSSDTEGNTTTGKQVRGNKKNIESANPWDSFSVRIDENNRK